MDYAHASSNANAIELTDKLLKIPAWEASADPRSLSAIVEFLDELKDSAQRCIDNKASD